MLLIVGLGNPGRNYENTRHNIGFMLVDRLASASKIRLEPSARRASWGRGVVAGSETLLLKPMTYMNLSGEAVKELAGAYCVPVEAVIAAYDDCDLPLGRIRIRRGGGSGGHRGVQSIIERLGGNNFPRLRLGIGRPISGELSDYVLGPFAAGERDALDEALSRGVEAIHTMVKEGIEAAMNRFN